MPGYCFAAIVYEERRGLYWRRLGLSLSGGISRAALAQNCRPLRGLLLPTSNVSETPGAFSLWGDLASCARSQLSAAARPPAPHRSRVGHNWGASEMPDLPDLVAREFATMQSNYDIFLIFSQKSRARDTKNAIKRLYSSKSACHQIGPPTQAPAVLLLLALLR